MLRGTIRAMGPASRPATGERVFAGRRSPSARIAAQHGCAYPELVLHVGPYEVLITVFVLLLITVGPVVAGITLAWVRGKKKPPA